MHDYIDSICFEDYPYSYYEISYYLAKNGKEYRLFESEVWGDEVPNICTENGVIISDDTFDDLLQVLRDLELITNEEFEEGVTE